MIELSRDGSVVKVSVHVAQANAHFAFSYDAGCEWAAQLLLSAMRDGLQASMEHERREEYERGWKDKASRRRPKSTWFSGRLP